MLTAAALGAALVEACTATVLSLMLLLRLLVLLVLASCACCSALTEATAAATAWRCWDACCCSCCSSVLIFAKRPCMTLSQLSHLFAPAVIAYMCSGQALHWPEASPEKLPGWHCSHVVLPRGAAVPALQGLHWLPKLFAKVPAGHSLQDSLASAEKLPGLQETHCEDPGGA